ICSPVPRKIWKDGKITRDQYGHWAAEVAKTGNVLFIDLNEIIARQYEAMGAEKVEALFADEHTHTSLAGAEINPASGLAGLKLLKPNPLAAYFSKKAGAVNPRSLTSLGRKVFEARFGEGKMTGTQVLPTTLYSKDRGYGFEPGANIANANGGVTGGKPFFF